MKFTKYIVFFIMKNNKMSDPIFDDKIREYADLAENAKTLERKLGIFKAVMDYILLHREVIFRDVYYNFRSAIFDTLLDYKMAGFNSDLYLKTLFFH